MAKSPKMYAELSSWWPVLSAPAEYADAAVLYRDILDSASSRSIRTLLELGSGGGNNASHLKAHYEMTLVDLAPGMLAVSRALNGDVEHFQGDMRTVRLNRAFDAVFIQDAILYMTTKDDLRAALQTAFAHCRPGGVALFAPDHTRETWRPSTEHGGHDDGDRSMRYLEWQYDPDPDDTSFACAFSFLLREGGEVRAVHEQHSLGLFARATWLELITEAGFVPKALPYRHESFDPELGVELFVGLRP